MNNLPFQEVYDLTDIEKNQSVSVNLNGERVIICHTEEVFFAFEDRCSHANIPLCGGFIKGTMISCPLHGAVFDLKTGAVLTPPASEDLKSYEVKIEGTTISLKAKSSNEET